MGKRVTIAGYGTKKVVLTLSGTDAALLEHELLLTIFSPKGNLREDYWDTMMADLYYALPPIEDVVK